MMFVGLADVSGKWADKITPPAAESEPAGAEVFPPNPADVFALTATARPPNTTRPAIRVGAGRLTIRTETRPQMPAFPGLAGSCSARTPPGRRWPATPAAA